MVASYTGFPKDEWGARNKREAREGNDGNEPKARAECDGKERDETALLISRTKQHFF